MDSLVRSSLVAALVSAAVVVAALAPAAPAANARTTPDPCTLLSTKQVAAVRVATSCVKRTGKPNPYYAGVSATWGRLAGRGSVILAVDRVTNPAYISLYESQNTQSKGKSVGVGSWSRGSCAESGVYCIVQFVVGRHVVELQVAPPQGDRIASPKSAVAMAKSVAAKLS